MAKQQFDTFYDFICSVFADQSKIAALSAQAAPYEMWSQLAKITGQSQPQLAQTLAKQLDMPFCEHCVIDEHVLARFPSSFVQKYGVAPLGMDASAVRVAIANPFAKDVIEQVQFVSENKARFELCSPQQIEEAMHDYFSNSRESGERNGVLVIQKGHPASSGEHSIVSLAQKLLTKAVTDSASDLHVQPYLGGGEVRERVDGVLRRVALLPQTVYEQLCRYFKAASNMDPSNERIIQDGRLSLQIDDTEFELRLSTLPARGGERLVIRFLDQQREFKLTRSGIATAEIQKLRQMVVNPSGIILLTGPTGSGKTTTLYSLLGEIDSPNINIITIENPVENTLPTISQVEVNEKAGLTFANVLRSVLRQDPDVILLGEIRDTETAQVATRAALTGHLVLSTVHTNDALSAITRLVELGVDESIVADSLTGVVSQRLCRRLCETCKEPLSDNLTQEELAFLSLTKIAPASRKNGCPKCDFTGYSGRFPITEILNISSAAERESIKTGEIHFRHSKQGKLNNLESISSSAARHIISGDTTVEEACRIIGASFWRDLAQEYDRPIPDAGMMLGAQLLNKDRDAILLLSENKEMHAMLEEMDCQWFDIFHASDSKHAKVALQSRPEIVYVVVDIPDHLNEDQIVTFVREARVDMAWSRLPALLLLPEGMSQVETALREDGAISPCVTKPLTDVSIPDLVKTALAEE
jgi:type II secretory ATPase GspE/PulE/Tfp pilus assembly ATPase PilB-like protein